MEIKLMPEYECFPLWGYIDNELNNIDPDDLKISRKLNSDLSHWANKFESTYLKENPVNSGFLTSSEEKEFIEEGYVLRDRLQFELGSNYEISLQL